MSILTFKVQLLKKTILQKLNQGVCTDVLKPTKKVSEGK